MAILFIILFLAAIAFRVYRLKKKQSAAPIPIKEFNTNSFDHLKKILNDTTKWGKYASTYDEVIVKKRRAKFIANYNEMITRQSMQEYALMEWTKFTTKIQNININPAKVFRSIIIPIIISLGGLTGFAQEAKNYIDDGNENYKSKNYTEALKNYNSALGFSLKPEKLASVHYKIAITFNKLKDCDSAKVHYAIALQNDQQNGGAASMSKFEGKLRECHLSKSELEPGVKSDENNNANESQVIPAPDPNNEAVKTQKSENKSNDGSIWIFVFFGIPFILFASWIIAKIIAAFAFNISSKQKRLDLDGFVHDDLFWNGLAANGYKSERVEEVKKVLENASNNLTASSSDIIVSNLHRHIYFIKNNPEAYFSENALTQGNLRYLIKTSEIDFYCFLTSEHLPEGKSNAFIIKHPSNSTLDKKVWISDRMKRMIEKKSKIKVRLHPVNGVYTHWSNDKTYYNRFTPEIPLAKNSEGNLTTMQKWVGEAREIDLNKYYEVFTGSFPNYIFPNDETILQGYVDYSGDVPEDKTGFDNRSGNYQQGDNYTTTSGIDPLLTGVVIGSMLSDHDRNRYDDSGHPISDVS